MFKSIFLSSLLALGAVSSGCHGRAIADDRASPRPGWSAQPVPFASMGAVFSSPVPAAASPLPLPMLSSGPEVSPSASPSVSPSDIPVLKITPAEMRALLTEYLRAQKTESRALEHRQDVELKDLKASQKVRLSEWKTKMNETRRKFFADHQGDSKTIQQFMHDRDDKYDAFVKMLDEERRARESDAKARMKSLQTDQADRLKEFRAYLSRGERPPRNLWP